MMRKTFSFSIISRHTWTAVLGLYLSSRKTTWTLRPWTPPFSARYFQYRSLLASKALWGNGAAPVTGAWMPIRMVVSSTPVRSTGPSRVSRGGAGVGPGPLGPGGRGAGAAADWLLAGGGWVSVSPSSATARPPDATRRARSDRLVPGGEAVGAAASAGAGAGGPATATVPSPAG